MPYAQNLGIMNSSDALLTLEFFATQSVWLPAKLVDYLGAARPLLGIVPPGTSSDFITRAGGLVALAPGSVRHRGHAARIPGQPAGPQPLGQPGVPAQVHAPDRAPRLPEDPGRSYLTNRM